ncbi:MAG: hypothetical protein B7Z16_17060, partial [Algoriphagus sp. 32-45-6]
YLHSINDMEIFTMTDLSNTNLLFLDAASKGNSSAIRNLLEKGIDVDISTKEGSTALFFAVNAHHHETVLLLLGAGANLNAIFHGAPILYFAIEAEDIRSTQILLDFGADPTINSNVAIARAAMKRHESEAAKQIYQMIMNNYLKTLDEHNNLQSRDFEVVVARYNEESLSWLVKEFVEEKVIVYNKGPDNLDLPSNFEVIKLPNIGREPHTYLTHIIRNYHKLANRTLFIQAYPYDHNKILLPLMRYKTSPITTCTDIVGECMRDTLGRQSKSLDNIDWKSSKWSDVTLRNDSMIEFAREYIDEELTADSLIYFQWGAQFAVDKEHILCHELDYHKKLLNTLNSQHPIGVHRIERLWNAWAKCKPEPVIATNFLSNSLNNTKIFILNLERSTQRWEKISKALDDAQIEYQRFNAVDGYKVGLINMVTNEYFKGADIINKNIVIQKNTPYKIPYHTGPSFVEKLDSTTLRIYITGRD